MDELSIHGFLQGLRRISRSIALYPKQHPLTQESLAVAIVALDEAFGSSPEFVINVRDEGLYRDGHLLPHASLEFSGLVHSLEARAVTSLTFRRPVIESDLFDLAAFLASTSKDIPAGGTILLNDYSLGAGAEGLSPLRRSYAGSLHSLRRATDGLAREGAFDLSAVMASVEDLVNRSLTETKAALLLSTVKSHDEYTFYHSVNTCILTLALGKLIGLTPEELLPIGTGALLHDIGKVALSPEVLNHAGKLSDDAWAEVRLHPQEGAQAILAAAGPSHEVAATVAFEHHSRFDGTGYPSAEGHREPHMFSNMVSVVDVYDALTTRRRYRRAETPTRALRALAHGMGSAHDPELVRAFIHMMGAFPPGSIVRLNDGTAVVVTAAATSTSEILGVRVLDSGDGKIEPEPVQFGAKDVVTSLSPERARIDPSSMLEYPEVVTQIETPEVS
ncbi:MAG: HD domain-containing phosphohydrolase [Acidimicrobiia bacterium]